MEGFQVNSPSTMRILFVGGTGIISSACTELALARGHDVHVLDRGRRASPPEGARSLVADIRDVSASPRACSTSRMPKALFHRLEESWSKVSLLARRLRHYSLDAAYSSCWRA